MFDAIGTAGTGLTTYHTWLDAISENIANVNTSEPMSQSAFQARFVDATAIPGGEDNVGQGVEATQLSYSDPKGIVTYSPNDPNADAQGYVRMPDINMNQQMGDMIMAERAYQANATTVDRATQAYQAAINIGKGL